MPDRSKTLARELHAAGLRKRYAKRVADDLVSPEGGRPPAARLSLAEDLRALAARVEGGTTAEHAEPHASARKAAAAPAAKPPTPSQRLARPRARKN